MDEFETVYGEGKDKKRVEMILVEEKAAGISLIQDLQGNKYPSKDTTQEERIRCKGYRLWPTSSEQVVSGSQSQA